MDAGALVASRLFWIALALVALLIALPLIWFRGRELGKEGSDGLWSALAYFSCLGAGFIIVEIILIQRFVLYLGNPTHALAVVLFVVLSCSGAGSALARAIPDDRLWPRLALVCLGVAALGTAHALFAEGAFHATIHLPIASKVAISVAMLAPLAVLMGMPMPTGIRILDRCGFHTLVPWCWAVNGATSVLGSIAALLGAMVYGFTVMMLVGVSIYLVAIPVVGRLHRRL